MKILKKILTILIQMGFVLMISALLILDFFFYDEEDISRWYPNQRLFLYIVILFIMICIVYFSLKYFCSKCALLRRLRRIPFHIDHAVAVCSFILFILQVYIAYNIYFQTGWDVGGDVLPAARLLAAGDIAGFAETSADYFSRYPNNIPMTRLFALLLRWNEDFGVWNGQNELMCIITVNCVINALTCFLTYRVIKDLMGWKAAIMGYALMIVLAGLSPWTVITYSDSLALIFPVAILFLYTRKTKRLFLKCLKFVAIISLSCIGYWIKPQTVIVAIAIVVMEFVWHLDSWNKKTVTNGLIILLVCGSCIGIFQGLSIQVHTIPGFDRDEERTLDMTHFFMMGLNESVNGTWSGEDIEFSLSLPTVEARHKANLKEGWKRIIDFGPVGYIRFLAKKLITAYGDGTFAWAGEGGFWDTMYEPQNDVASPWLRSFYYDTGENYRVWTYTEQSVWLAVLIFVACNFAGRRSILGHLHTKNDLVILLSLEGLTLYLMLFEVRARYLYTYVPFFVILAVSGLRYMVRIIEKAEKTGMIYFRRLIKK